MVKNLLSNVGDVGAIPRLGTKIPHAMRQLSPRTATTKAAHSRAHVPQLESTHAATTEPTRSGACAPQLERSPHAATKSPLAKMKDLTCRN